jgi:hypothetical protein
MKRIGCIVTFVAVLFSTGYGQIRSMNGQLLYQARWEDFLSGGVSSTNLNQSPTLGLGVQGIVVSPYLLTFELRTNLFANFSRAQAGGNAITGKQYTWNYYDLNLGFLQNSSVSAVLSARDALSEASTDYRRNEIGVMKRRYQRQDARVSLNKILSLPSILFAYSRNHEYSITALSPFEVTQNTYSVNLSSSNSLGSIFVSGSINDNWDAYAGTRMKYTDLHFQGSRMFSTDENLNVDLDYDKFESSVHLVGGAAYATKIDNKYYSTSSVHGRSNSGPLYHTMAVGASQSLSFVQDSHFRLGFSLGGQYARDVYTVANVPSATTAAALSAGGSVQHTRALGRFNITNDLNAGLSLENYQRFGSSVSFGFANGIQTTVKSYRVSLNQRTGYVYHSDGVNQTMLTNSASGDITGTIRYNLQGQVFAIYNASHSPGSTIVRGRKDLSLVWRLNSSFNSFIPFTVGLSGNTNWYYSEHTGRTYGWSLTVMSARFFVQQLSMNYALTRNFDYYYDREAISNNLGFNYRWRSLTMELRLNQYDRIDRHREVWFSIVRPF